MTASFVRSPGRVKVSVMYREGGNFSRYSKFLHSRTSSNTEYWMLNNTNSQCYISNLFYIHSTLVSLRYFLTISPIGQVWHKAFFKVCPGAGPLLRLVRHSPKCLGSRYVTRRDSEETHLSRSVPLIPRPAEVCPINWIQLSKIDPTCLSTLVWPLSDPISISTSSSHVNSWCIIHFNTCVGGPEICVQTMSRYRHNFLHNKRIPADLNSVVVWMVLILSLISNSLVSFKDRSKDTKCN